ncbi:MAG TPA: hypothetical protein VD866_02925 [Urbifossiella sp.]|nr:hypothetical protein [Urbifossiella sp.]
MTPLPAARALDQFYLDARSRVLDLAATLDRIGRGADTASVAADPRLALLRQALEVLLSDAPNRAERVQQVFSLAYDAGWERPKPRF